MSADGGLTLNLVSAILFLGAGILIVGRRGYTCPDAFNCPGDRMFRVSDVAVREIPGPAVYFSLCSPLLYLSRIDVPSIIRPIPHLSHVLCDLALIFHDAMVLTGTIGASAPN